MTFPDSYGSGQDAVPPAPAQGNYPPPPGFTAAPAVPPGYGYAPYPAVAVPPGMYVDQVSGLLLPDGTELAASAAASGLAS